MKKLLIIALVLTMVLLATSSQTLAAQKPIKIGIIVPLSGIIAQSGIEMRDGIEMAGKEQGTVLGRPIEFVVEDTQVKADVAVSKAEKLVYKDGCIALIGVMSSGVGLAIGRNIENLRVPLVLTQPVSKKIYGLHKYVFRCGQLVTDQAGVGNSVGIANDPDLQRRKFYVLVLDYSYGHDAAEDFIRFAKEQGVKIVNENYDKAPVATTDWSSYITKIKASGADGIFVAIFTNAFADFSRQCREFGLNARIIAPAAPGPMDLEKAGKAGAGILCVTNWSWDVNTPASDAWEMKYWEQYKTIPGNAAVCSYVAAKALFKGIEKAGSTDVDKIAEAMKGISVDGPLGVVRISPKDNSHRMGGIFAETQVAPPNPFGAKMYIKVLRSFTAEELGPPE
jgi:branched-chain amino acid transport system substrate-binding protein